jgi:hypothetical protein
MESYVFARFCFALALSLARGFAMGRKALLVDFI